MTVKIAMKNFLSPLQEILKVKTITTEQINIPWRGRHKMA